METYSAEIYGVSLCDHPFQLCNNKLELSQHSVKSVNKRAGFLSLNQIFEVVWDSKSYEAGAPSNNTSENEGGFERVKGVTPATGPTNN